MAPMYCLASKKRFIAAFLGSLFSLSALPAVAATPNDPLYPRQWYLNQVHAPEAWDVTTGSSDVVVAVLDAGTDLQHPDLQGAGWKNIKEIPGNGIDDDLNGYVDDVHGWNFVTDTGDTRPIVLHYQPDEALAHGTIVSSLIAARGNDGIGMAGIAWKARIMPLVVLDGSGFGNVPNIRKAIEYAMAQKADIINLSLVGYEQDDDLDRAIKAASDAGILVVVAAGNSDVFSRGEDLEDQPVYPACSMAGSKHVLAVSATDALDQKAPYANYGHTCVGISAPGFQIVAAHPFAFEHASSTSYISGLTGTSLAAPLVSGAAALVKSLRPNWTPKQIRAHLIATSDPIDPIQAAYVRNGMGRGRLNVGRAVTALRPRGAVTGMNSILARLKLFLP